MNRSTSILIQAGFNSRLAAIKAVTDTAATFTTGAELRAWLRSPDLAAWSAQPDWPTAETRAIWLEFIQEFAPSNNRTWRGETILEMFSGSLRPRLRVRQSASFIGTDSHWFWRPTGTQSGCCYIRSTPIDAVSCERAWL